MRLRLAAVALVAAACGSQNVVVAPETPTTQITTTSTAGPTSTLAPTTPPTAEPPTTEPPATGSTTTAPPTTTAASPPALFIAGSPMIRFSVEVGEGIDLSRDELARFVADTLSDERSWVSRGAGFELLDEGGDFTMIVALPATVDELCAPLQTIGQYSCARNGWVAFNSLRWFGATDDWPTDLDTYRHYLVNHEVGHYILGPNHETCPGPGELAPVMMQQTKGLDGCLPNGWVEASRSE